MIEFASLLLRRTVLTVDEQNLLTESAEENRLISIRA